MIINKVGLSNVAFGKNYIVVDIGASVEEGSFKVAAITEDGKKVIARNSGTVFNKGERRSESIFEERVAERIFKFYSDKRQLIIDHDPEGEKGKTDVVIAYPGPIVRNRDIIGAQIVNIRHNDHTQFERPISGVRIDTLLANRGINIGNTRHANDMAAAGAAILNILKEKYPDTLKEDGREILFLYPGGGPGVGEIVIEPDFFKIKPTDKGAMVVYNPLVSKKPYSFAKQVQSSGLIENFAEAMELTPNEKAAMREKTEVVTNYDAYCQALGSEAVSRKRFDREKFDVASKSAIDRYIEAFAQMTVIKICDGKTNTVVLTGKIANGIAESVNNNPLFKAPKDKDVNDDKFTAIFKAEIRRKLAEVEWDFMGKDSDFNVIVLPLENNTEGAYSLANAAVVGEVPRSYNIPKNVQESEIDDLLDRFKSPV